MYKGESPAKKISRWRLWTMVMRHLGYNRFIHGKHLVLASFECGDIYTLKTFGVEDHNIIAVDLDEEAIEICRARFPGVAHAHQGDVVDVVKRYRRELVTAYLDFCGPLGKRTVDTMISVITAGMKNDSLIGASFMSGREQGGFLELVKSKKSVLVDETELLCTLKGDELIEQYKKNHEQHISWGEGGDHIGWEVVLQQLQAEMLANNGGLSDATKKELKHAANTRARTNALSSLLVQRMSHLYKVSPYSVYTSDYYSQTSDRKGVRMFTYLGRVFRGLPSWSQKKFAMKLREALLREPEPLHDSVSIRTDNDFRREVLRLKDALDTFLPPDRANRLLASSFGLQPQTVAAWKAHRTMGRYAE